MSPGCMAEAQSNLVIFRTNYGPADQALSELPQREGGEKALSVEWALHHSRGVRVISITLMA